MKNKILLTCLQGNYSLGEFSNTLDSFLGLRGLIREAETCAVINFQQKIHMWHTDKYLGEFWFGHVDLM